MSQVPRRADTPRSALAAEIAADLAGREFKGRATLAGLVEWLGERPGKVAMALDELIRTETIVREGALFMLADQVEFRERPRRESRTYGRPQKDPDRTEAILKLLRQGLKWSQVVERLARADVTRNIVAGVAHRHQSEVDRAERRTARLARK